MRLEWIEDILAVLDTGSLARAAEKRLLTQSAFTRRVRLIEDTIGVELFDRRRKPVTVNAGVETLAPEMRDLAMRLRRLRQNLRTSVNQTGGTLSFACQHAITTTVSPWVIRALTDNTEVSVRVRSCNREECLMLLLSGEVDFALMYTLPEDSTSLEQAFETVTLGHDDLVPVCAPSFEPLSDTGQIACVSYPPEVFLGSVFIRKIAPRLKDDVTLLSRAETALTLAAYEYALDGIGVAWLPRSMVAEALEQGRLMSLAPDLPVQPLDIKSFRVLNSGTGHGDAAWMEKLSRLALPASFDRCDRADILPAD